MSARDIVGALAEKQGEKSAMSFGGPATVRRHAYRGAMSSIACGIINGLKSPKDESALLPVLGKLQR